MSVFKYTADHVFDGTKFLENKIIVTDKGGSILGIEDLDNHDPSSIQKLNGTLTPGLINTHCHLELSHMKGLVNTGTTLLPFIDSVVKYRDFAQDIIDEAIENADMEMQANGIVAVGDISNKADTAKVKARSPIHYYTFVEYFDLMHPPLTASTIKQYDEVYEAHESNNKNKKSKVPHAPYSVTKELFDYLAKDVNSTGTVSIHSEETIAEMDLFKSKTGGFIDLFGGFGVDFAEINAINKTSIHHTIANLSSQGKTLFVHNTLTDLSGLSAANKWKEHCFFATCPNANLYIENRLPNYQIFLDTKQKVTIGTDSLTSNWQLSIWEEIKTIFKFCSYVPIEELLIWATKNGAEALGYDGLGQLTIGKTPGLVLLPMTIINNKPIIIDGKESRII